MFIADLFVSKLFWIKCNFYLILYFEKKLAYNQLVSKFYIFFFKS